MANEEHIRTLLRSVDAWNGWRDLEGFKPDLAGANLMGANLAGAYLLGADLTRANLFDAHLAAANLEHATLSQANIQQATLWRAKLNSANLAGANLMGASLKEATAIAGTLTNCCLISTDLEGADLTFVDMSGSNLENANLVHALFHRTKLAGVSLIDASLFETIFSDLDLSGVMGLESCRHLGPSVIDYRTLQKSGSLPLRFLRGLGLPENLLDYLPSLLSQPIQHYSCFISYSTKDQHFGDRIHADLQNKGVRCWFAPHHMQIGAKILDTIDEAIRLRDKVLLILSEHSIKSDWVEDEVTQAFEEERKRGQTVLFPIRLDDAVMDTNEAWAAKLRARHIGDFRRWKEHDEYQKSFERVLRDLTVKKKEG